LPGDNESQALAINESGSICGVSGSWRAFLWEGGQMSPLNLPMGPNSMAHDISNDGRICGWMGIQPYIKAHAYIWSPQQVIDLGTVLPEAIGAVANSLNETGSACGFAVYEDPVFGFVRHAFLWSNGVKQYLGTLPGFAESRANDLNDSNTVVGICTASLTVGSTAFVWEDGIIYELDELVPQALNLQIVSATAINNAGQIAAYGYSVNGTGNFAYVAMRLNPIPALSGDLNCDSQVNVPDLLAVISAWGPCPPQPPGQPFTETCHADFNDDGVVNHHDIVAVVLNWTP